MANTKCTVATLEEIAERSWSVVPSVYPAGCDEVSPGVFISNWRIAKDRETLKKLGITHVLNAAQGPEPFFVKTDADYYEPFGITFKGFAGEDAEKYNISQHFDEAAEYIQGALDAGGKVLVHCIMGISRAPTLVIAYLMKRCGMTAQEAMKTVREKRDICPNEGFLQQLCDLNETLSV
ncbi:dual specificity protein phosphatase 3-like isoform X2 [Lineus longissimus]|uniref:dual specificity protein phosphatase 3-like isoform X2 n=1 Tax=Lineus longissimus TaxID=88925 RepID=UPI002B4C4BFA